MKNKRILFVIFIIALLSIASYSSAATCTELNGTCKATCATGETTNLDGSASCRTAIPYCCIPSQNNGNNTTGSTATIEFPNPLKYSTVEQVLTSLLNALQGVIVVISIIFIVIGAIFYITSAGNDQRMETAKKAIFASLIGLAIGIAAPTFLKEIYTILGAKNIPEEVSSAPTIATIALKTLDFLLSIVGTIALIMLIVGAIMYLTAAGNEDQIDKGKKLFKYALVGITVALASLVIIKQIAGFFS